MAKFCGNCGAKHEDTVKFCTQCGDKFPVPVSDPVPQVVQPVQPVQQPAPATQFQPQQPQQPQQQQPAQQYQPPVVPPVIQQPVQPAQQQFVMYTEKQKVLYDAPYMLNKPDQPWQITVEGDKIIARWKWMDASFFAPHEVSNETRDYTFTVILSNNGTWHEVDYTENRSAGVKVKDGKVGFGTSSNMFVGKKTQKSFEFGAGKNNQTGETGLIGFKFDTTMLKEPVRTYLTNYGWKKAGMFG